MPILRHPNSGTCHVVAGRSLRILNEAGELLSPWMRPSRQIGIPAHYIRLSTSCCQRLSYDALYLDRWGKGIL